MKQEQALALARDLKARTTVQRRRVEDAERERLAARPDASKLRQVDERLVTLRFELAETLLSLSMARRDAGDHEGALDAARLFSEQEHLARTTRDNLARVV